VAVAATFPVVIYWALRRLGAAPAAARRAAAVAGVGTALWLGLTGVLGAAGALRFDTTPPTAMLAITAMWILAVALGVSRVGERLALGLPLAALVGVQGFRLPLELLMHRAYTEGVMPVQMSYSGWNFDIVTGISALAVAALLAAGRMPLWGVRVWNWMGLALLANIVTIAMFSTPTPLRVFTNEPANVWITHTPFVWLPMVMVMAAIVGHIVILRRLRAESARRTDGPPSTARPLIRSMLPAAVLALFAAAPIAGQQAGDAGPAGAPPAPSFPATPMGAAAQAMVDAVNAGDAEIRRFVEAHASPDLAGRVTATQYAATLRKLREQSGGMELVTTMPGGGAAVRMLLRSKAGGHFLGVEIGPDPERPDRFASIGFHPMLSDPRTGSGLWNPEGETDDAVLGAVIEKVTGRRYHDHVRDRVFRAAVMTDTEPGPDGAIPNAAVRYYREPLDDPLAIGTRIPKVEAAPGVGEAMGGSYLTARDLFRFARALRTNRLLSPALTDTVVSGKVPLGPGPARYAFGFYDVDHGTPVRGHSGGGAGSGIDADLEILWDADYTVVVIGNYDTPASRAVAQGIVRLIAHRFRNPPSRL
jgi:hypothetical protein